MPLLVAAGAATAQPVPTPGASTPQAAPVSEQARRACRDDAFRLCPAQVALMSRSRVRACLGEKVAQLSPPCAEVIRAGNARRQAQSQSQSQENPQ
jgi:hypothetical protein